MTAAAEQLRERRQAERQAMRPAIRRAEAVYADLKRRDGGAAAKIDWMVAVHGARHGFSGGTWCLSLHRVTVTCTWTAGAELLRRWMATVEARLAKLEVAQ